MIYLDTSAFLRTVRAEPQSAALSSYLANLEAPQFISSALLSVEARRSVATAVLIRDDIEVLISYDKRMLTAVAAQGLPIAAPA